MKIIGIDPGYERLGIAVLEKKPGQKKELVIFSECFKTSTKLPFPKRLLLLGQEVKTVIKKYNPEVLAIETLFLNTNHKTAMGVSAARGVILYEAIMANLEILEVSPPQIKNAVSGYGGASKSQVEKMVRLLVEFKEVLKNNHGADDEMDAIAIALSAFALRKTPIN